MKTTANKGSIGQSVVNNNSHFKICCKKGHAIKLGSFHYNICNFVRAAGNYIEKTFLHKANSLPKI